MAEGIAKGRRQAFYGILKGVVIVAPIVIGQWQRSRERVAAKPGQPQAD